MRRAALVVAVGVACADLRSAPPAPDGGAVEGGPGPSSSSGAASSSSGGLPTDGGDADADVLLPPEPDAGVGPADPCRVTPPACLDPAAPNVIDVPAEATMANALATAKAGDVIQFRSVLVEESFQLPPSVSLHGCETGTLHVSRNIFTPPPLAVDGSPGIFVTNLSGAAPRVIVLDSRFSARTRGIRVQGAPQPAGAIRLDVSNAVFDAVSSPLIVSNVRRGRRSRSASPRAPCTGSAPRWRSRTLSRASIDSCIFALGDVVVDGRGVQDSPSSLLPPLHLRIAALSRLAGARVGAPAHRTLSP